MIKDILVLMTGMAFLLGLATAAMAADPFVGTWKLNLSKLKIAAGPTPKNWTVKIDLTDESYRFVDDVVDAQGTHHTESKLPIADGKEHAVTAYRDFRDSYAVTRVDAYTLTIVSKKGGKEVARAQFVVSKDGKALTMTTTGGYPHIGVFVYDKQ